MKNGYGRRLEVPVAVVRVVVVSPHLGRCWLPEERAGFSKKIKRFHAPAPTDFSYLFISVGFQHNSTDHLVV